ncbi:hypothetical protein BD779DRAFT_1465328 [Infundibulicybe gibba]|nr:hypothetical protein BD779DRAFT_1465328 [Infundibulicybe gibba]
MTSLSYTAQMLSLRTQPDTPNSDMEKTRQSPTSLLPVYTKDIRAYEHERQRAKKVADTAKMRERKVNRWPLGFYVTKKGTSTSEKSKRPQRDDDEGLAKLVESKREPGSEYVITTPASKFEVKLEDLLTPPKHRKKGKSILGCMMSTHLLVTIETDFEVVPHVRSVIALDDDIIREPGVDEGWEHISSDEDQSDGPKTPSYATVVSLSREQSI